MITIERTVRTDHEPAKVFNYLSDFTNATEWDAGTVACTLIQGDGGVGTSYLNTSRFVGRETDLTYVVKALDPNALFVIEGSNDTLTSVDTMRLRPDRSGTELTYTAEFTFSGAARLVEPLLRIPLKRLGDDAKQSLREALRRL